MAMLMLVHALLLGVNPHNPCPDGITPPAPVGYCNCSSQSLVCTESVPSDLPVPPVVTFQEQPEAGKRVAQTHKDWSHTKVYHSLYLPANWSNSSAPWPLVVEFSGNGIEPQDSNWTVNGWGLTQGRFIWLSLPFVSALRGNSTCNQRNWFGCDPSACDLYSAESNKICAENKTSTSSYYNPGPTVSYAIAAVRMIIQRYNVDTKRVLLTGHSRGSLAVNFIGLHNEEIAGLWSAFVPSSHYDGVKHWAYPGSDNASALVRLKRVGSRPVFIVAECDLSSYAREYLERTGVDISHFRIEATGFADHNSFWSLRPDPLHARQHIREWIQKIFRL